MSQESSAIVDTSGGGPAAPSTIQTTKMKASVHIMGGSTLEVGQSGSVNILVQDAENSKDATAQPEPNKTID